MKDSKIYITNYFPYQNYDDAFRHTTLSRKEAQRNIFDGVFPLRNLNKLCFEIGVKIEDSLESDLLLLTGKGILDGFVLWIWLMKHQKVNILIYDQRQKRYIPRALSAEDLTNLKIGRGNEKSSAKGED